METPKTLQEAVLHFADFENCKAFMSGLRWPDGVVKCPNCGSDHVVWLANARLWKCYGNHERPKFSLKTGTIFEDSPLGLDKWLAAAWLICNCKNGISSYEIGRDLGISQKSAWHMMHRLRFAFHHGSFNKLSGQIEADETFIGGKGAICTLRSARRKSPALAARTRLPLWGFWNAAARCARPRFQTAKRKRFNPKSASTFLQVPQSSLMR